MKKRVLTGLSAGIAFLILLSCLVSCGGKPAESPGTEPPTSPAQQPGSETVSDNLPERDMDGFRLGILSYTDAAHGYSLKVMAPEEAPDDGVELAIYQRNMRMEDRFGCLITENQVDRPYDVMRNEATAQNPSNDVAMIYEEHINRILVATPTGLTPFADIPYLNPSQPYWNQDANDTYSISGYQYAGIGDWCLSMYSKVYTYFLNKNVYRTVEQEKDIYDLVRDREWTLERMYELAGRYSQELDGEDGWTAGDRYGIVGTCKVHYQLLLTGAGLKFVDKDGNGAYAFAFRGTAADTRIAKILELNGGSTYYDNTPGEFNGAIKSNEFISGRALLLAATITNLGGVKAETEGGAVGVLPAPMWDEEQADYCSVAIGGLITCFPSFLPADRLENIGILVEALSCDSYNNVVPYYKEVLLKSSRADSPDDAQMMDILFGNLSCDLGCSTWANDIRLPVIREIFLPRQTNYTSAMTLLAAKANTAIGKTTEAINALLAARG